MPRKATTKKAAKAIEEVAKKETNTVHQPAESGQYFYAVGKRKTAVAQVRVYPGKGGKAEVLANGRGVTEYFPVARMNALAIAPLVATSNAEKFSVEAKIQGGGKSSQAEALRLGIARALVKFDETLKKQLRDLGYMTRDAREVERKKPGLKKARRAPQWAKR